MILRVYIYYYTLGRLGCFHRRVPYAGVAAAVRPDGSDIAMTDFNESTAFLLI